MIGITVVKAVGGIVVSSAVSMVVNNAVKMATPENIGKVAKIATAIGGAALSFVISDKVTSYIEVKVDDTIEVVKGIGKDEESQEA